MKYALAIFDLDGTLCDPDPLGGDVKKVDQIKPYEGASTVLSRLPITKVLVTRGDETIQNRKLAILGFAKYFSKIVICSKDEEKHSCFEKIIWAHRTTDPSHALDEVVVIGNRRDCEIRYGKMLGCITILVNQGRYKVSRPKDEFEQPDYVIEDIRDLLELEIF